MDLVDERKDKELTSKKWEDILQFFPVEIRQILARVPGDIRNKVIEIRIRLNQPLELNLGSYSVLLSNNGELVEERQKATICRQEDMKKILTSLTAGSLYALAEEFSQGY